MPASPSNPEPTFRAGQIASLAASLHARVATRRWRLATVLLLAFAATTVFAAAWLHTRSTVKFEAEVSEPTKLQVFHSADGGFTEDSSEVVGIRSRKEKIRLRLPSGDATHLRIDPAPGSAPLRLCELRGRDGAKFLYDVIAANDVEIRHEETCMALEFSRLAPDPFVVLKARIQPVARTSALWIAAMSLAALTALAALSAALRIVDGAPGVSRVATSTFAWCWRRAHWLALVLMLVLGTLILQALPPNGVPDEAAHLSKIAKIDGGVWLGDSGSVPVVDVYAMYGTLRGRVERPGVLDDAELQRLLEQPLACNRAPRALPTSADQYAPHLYAVPSLVLAASCSVGTTFDTFLDLARFFNLLIGACLVAYGIRHAAFGKWALFAIALLPMTLSQVASISADSLVLSLSFCFLGVVSGVAGGTFAPERARLVLPALALMLALAKPGAAWILAAVLFCYPAYRVARARYAELAMTAMILPWILHIAWTIWSAGKVHPRSGVEPEANLAMLTEQPMMVARMAYNTFFGDGMLGLYQSMIGRLGWLDIPLSSWAYSVAGGILLASLWTNPDGTRIPVLTRVVAIGAALGSLALLAFPLFLAWTLPDASMIEGLQGRYFLPTLAFVLVFCALRAGPALRLLLLACVLCMPALTFDALANIQMRYHGSAW
ncbi:DUF2142 domain-containing protein [Luteimonas sp. MC1572]|uniref:DUF2142 domain-containing protein n=1 Tax=Luteimonas sp. MC1572 TaxID=2799325 RepID=UPI0018F0B263|nr:DUF2142 domain-containing protein [Luteimonas sp. MC1572]MBJ6982362.1 DUF2142 domain-containing protein [Luteimonas sp. MC1572]QQO03628.1 DUF2142 domain-containing protein [Luteimonas sp. MC1572]